MWNLRSNSDVLDETWWEAGGNDLWKKYAHDDNVNRETNTLFLTDEQWAEFKEEAEKLPGWVGIDPFPHNNPLWAAKQSIFLYICTDPWVWLQSIDPRAKDYCRKIWEANEGDDRQIITDCVNECIETVIERETNRWEVFGIVPKRIDRIYGLNRVIAEWQDEYDAKFWNGMRTICVRAGVEFSTELHRLLNRKLMALTYERQPEQDDTYSAWEWLQADPCDDDDEEEGDDSGEENADDEDE